MATDKIPEIFIREPIHLKPYYYDRYSREFYVGDLACGLSQFDIEINAREALKTLSGPQQVRETIVAFGVYLNPITGRRFQNWFSEQQSKHLFQDTTQVMREVYGQMSGEELGDESDDPVTGFSVGLSNANQLRLSVVGNNTCMYPNAGGIFIGHEEWYTGFTEYTYHNIENQLGNGEIQKVSLLAGLGHLAALAAEIS